MNVFSGFTFSESHLRGMNYWSCFISDNKFLCLESVFVHYFLCCSSSDLQREQEAANSRHQAEVSELKHHLSCMNSLVERGNQALQQKAQVMWYI